MLGKDKTMENDSPSISRVERPAPTEARTIIGKQVIIEGNIQGKEDLHIEGSVKGTIGLEERHLIIGPDGQVEAEINAKNVTISGKVAGKIRALGKISITKEAEVSGEMHAKSISIEDGAYFKGAIELEREPNRKLAVTKKANAVSASLPDKEPKVLPGKEAKNGS